MDGEMFVGETIMPTPENVEDSTATDLQVSFFENAPPQSLSLSLS